MFDYQFSKQAHFDNACRAFANTHKGDLVQIAESIGMNAQMLRNKLNPEQPHQLTCIDLMKLTDATEDASILDGVLEQMQCQPSVPVNEACDSNVPAYLLTAVGEVGKLATNTVSGGNLNNARVAEFKRSVNTASPDAITGRAENRTIAQQQIDNAYPELSAGLHLPKFARVEAPTENTTAGDISDPFRPKYAVDVQMVDADGNDVAPVYHAVPLPLPMAGNESGMFQYPPVGSMVEIAFENGRADKPFIRQVLSHGNTLPDIKPGEQLQQQRQEVSQRVTQDGTWHRQTDQKIIEESMHREVKTDTENRTVIARETTVQATDKTTVIGTSTLMAGAIMQIAEGDFSQATQANRVIAVGQNMTIDVGQKLEEKIGAVRSSIAGAMQKIMAPVVYLGNEQLNVMQCMLDTLDVVNELATLTASHTHNNTGSPLNASAISNTGTKSTGLKQKYSPVIG
ncbi:phage regulatory CII family protein [Proteus sp. fly-1089]|uniref:phage regulatory CII family protein n=1 Tax=Proteus sp. fly-1089 TaxID=3136675 RepID=UPI0032DA43AF